MLDAADEPLVLVEPPVGSPMADANAPARWAELRAGFVDDPARAVAAADQLALEAVRHFSATLEAERMLIEHDWRTEEAPSTETLRRSLQRYGAFIEKLGGSLDR